MSLKKGYFKPLSSPEERKTNFSVSMGLNTLSKLDEEVINKGTSRSSFIEEIIKMYFTQKEKLYG